MHSPVLIKLSLKNHETACSRHFLMFLVPTKPVIPVMNRSPSAITFGLLFLRSPMFTLNLRVRSMKKVHKKKHVLHRANVSLRGCVKLVLEDWGGPSRDSCNVLKICSSGHICILGKRRRAARRFGQVFVCRLLFVKWYEFSREERMLYSAARLQGLRTLT